MKAGAPTRVFEESKSYGKMAEVELLALMAVRPCGAVMLYFPFPGAAAARPAPIRVRESTFSGGNAWHTYR